ncbi:uncharacterized protein N7503_006358 [Penicillium pulvis]|uniref:uncharacterized protein n=1 Tax=Penicillium pulvis TaxID=1562058 RepID=UPI002547E0C2|nr:uncharacterized protein N7503_006358 [Penicillium pulvis]KAJ5798853.1 hypothetical protein N7503_006358 [Penicillium pulvis]
MSRLQHSTTSKPFFLYFAPSPSPFSVSLLRLPSPSPFSVSLLRLPSPSPYSTSNRIRHPTVSKCFHFSTSPFFVSIHYTQPTSTLDNLQAIPLLIFSLLRLLPPLRLPPPHRTFNTWPFRNIFIFSNYLLSCLSLVANGSPVTKIFANICQIATNSSLVFPMLRLEGAFMRFERKRRIEPGRGNILHKYLQYGGISVGPSFGGGTLIEKERGSLDISFDKVIRSFFSTYYLRYFNPEAVEDIEPATDTIRNFLTFLLFHDACPAYNDDVLQARKICIIANMELWEEWQPFIRDHRGYPTDFIIKPASLSSRDQFPLNNSMPKYHPASVLLPHRIAILCNSTSERKNTTEKLIPPEELNAFPTTTQAEPKQKAIMDCEMVLVSGGRLELAFLTALDFLSGEPLIDHHV